MNIKLIFILLLFSCVINAQMLSSKWIKVISFNDKDIYVDTSNITQEKNIISAVIMTFYKQPALISLLNKEIVYTKTQALFDINSRKVTIVGNLYYDKLLKIISEPFKPIQITSENNSHLIDTSKIYSAVLDSCVSYLKKNPVKKYQTKILIEGQIKLSEDSLKKESLESEIIRNYEYDFSKERNVYKTIFTDGKKYCIQISSWKEEYKAEREVNRLKSKGHNAFYVKADIPGKGIWYRVRIGFFDSLQEAEEYEKEMK